MLTQDKDQFATLRVDQIHVWHASIEEVARLMPSQSIEGILSLSERESLAGFSQKQVREQYLATRVLIRSVLSFYKPDYRPCDWRFEKNEYGKPAVDARVDGRPLQFNLSHSRGLVVVALGLDAAVGVDVEFRQSKPSLLEMTSTIFSKEEAAALHSLPPNRILRRFFEYWTLKEAYIKAKGMGLSLPLDEFSFRFPTESRIAIKFSDKIPDQEARWQFRLFEASQGYQGALAVQATAEQPVSVVHMGNFLKLSSRRAA